MTRPEAIDPRLRQAMQRVLLATLPGLLVLLWLYSWGPLLNLLLAATGALAMEALVLLLRRRPLPPALGDGSALVSATLLALALPPYCPWWLPLSAAASAMLFAKQLYGGVGQNPFNPAMLGYALALLCFPQSMTHWPAPHALDLLGGLQQVFGLGDSLRPDAGPGHGAGQPADQQEPDRRRTLCR